MKRLHVHAPDSGAYLPLVPDAEYVIRNEDGQYYTGRSGDSPTFWADHVWDAFKYTASGALRKRAAFPEAFQYCRIVRT
mgnify:CR=1 FL=1